MKNKLKLIFAFILGICVTSGVVYAANLLASNIAYDNTNSGLKDSNNQDVTDVQTAIDVLYSKTANAGIPIDPNTFQTNTAKTVLASSKGVCIKRNNKLNCFKINNWAEEQNHIQQVFSDIICTVDSSYVGCVASDFICDVSSGGSVYCEGNSDDSYCFVASDGAVSCG